jgi:predicted lysophospholipase L1 biosynthesis ABC-type transport system permease subunit
VIGRAVDLGVPSATVHAVAYTANGVQLEDTVFRCCRNARKTLTTLRSGGYQGSNPHYRTHHLIQIFTIAIIQTLTASVMQALTIWLIPWLTFLLIRTLSPRPAQALSRYLYFQALSHLAHSRTPVIHSSNRPFRP